MKTTIRRLARDLSLAALVALASGLHGNPVAAQEQCDGDCDNDGSVTVDELLVMVNIALGTVAPNACAAGDINCDDRITVDEILAAVNSVLSGCAEPGITVLASSVKFIPDSINTAVPTSSHLIVRGRDLFWSDGSDIPVKRMVLPCRRVTPVVRRTGVPDRMLLRGRDVFWTETQSGISLSGCTGSSVIRLVNRTSLDTGERTVLARTDNCVEGTADFVVDATDVYWVASLASPNLYTIETVPLAGGTPTTVASTSVQLVALTGDDTYLYWQESGFPDPDGSRSVINRMAKSGGPVEPLATDLRALRGGLVLHEETLFFADTNFANQHRVMRVSTAGGPVSLLAEIEDPTFTRVPRQFAVDQERLYWVDEGTLNAIPQDGGSITTLATGVDSPRGLAVDAASATWTEAPGFTGRIRRIALAGDDALLPTGPVEAGAPVTILVDGIDTPGALALDASFVYWTEGGTAGPLDGGGRIATVPIGGGSISTVDGGVSVPLPPIAADDTHVYFADRAKIKAVSVDGAPPENLIPGRGFAETVVDIAVDGAHVYWIEEPNSTVRAVPRSGGEVRTLATGAGRPVRIGVDATHVYWIEGFFTIKKVPLAGGNVTTVASALPFLSDFVVDGTRVYFSEQDTGNIRSISVDGGPITTLARGLPGSWNILALDQDHVYWIHQTEVAKVDKTGASSAVILAGELESEAPIPNAVTVDDTSVYWTEVAGGTIKRGPK